MKTGMTNHRVIVTGSRSWPDEQAVWRALGFFVCEQCPDGDTVTVVHGGCPTGADHYASTWCALPMGDDVDVVALEERHPADWDRYGKAAGPLRNREMVDLGAELVLAFPLPGPRSLSRGTWDCIDAAAAHGIPVEIIVPQEAA